MGSPLFIEKVFPDFGKTINPTFAPIASYRGAVKVSERHMKSIQGPEKAQLPSLEQIQSFSLGGEQTLNLASQSSDAGAGKAHFGALTIERAVDQYSPALFLYLTSGKTLVATVAVTSGVGRGAVQLSAVYKFGFAYVASQVQTGNDGAPRETLMFEYGQLTMMQGAFGNDGSVSKVTVSGWDIMKNTKNNNAS